MDIFLYFFSIFLLYFFPSVNVCFMTFAELAFIFSYYFVQGKFLVFENLLMDSDFWYCKAHHNKSKLYFFSYSRTTRGSVSS